MMAVVGIIGWMLNLSILNHAGRKHLFVPSLGEAARHCALLSRNYCWPKGVERGKGGGEY